MFSPEYLCSVSITVSLSLCLGGGDIRDVQEPILVLVLLVYRAHQSSRRRQDLIDKDEDGLLGRQLDALPYNVDELANREIGGDEVLLLVDGRDIALLDLLADDLIAISRLQLHQVDSRGGAPECGRCTSGGCAPPRPCASQRGARP